MASLLTSKSAKSKTTKLKLCFVSVDLCECGGTAARILNKVRYT